METAILVGAVIFVILVHLVFAAMMEHIAIEKGYENSRTFLLVLLFGMMGCIYVLALPDKKAAQQREDILAALLMISQGDET